MSLDEEIRPVVFVKRDRQNFGVMLLNSLFNILRKSIFIFVLLGIVLMFGPLIL